jgi:YihY family inner membrane protein
MGSVQRLLKRIDRFQQTHTWAAVPYAVIKKFGDDEAGNLAALIAYYAFFSIFPLLLVFFTVAGFTLSADMKKQLADAIHRLLRIDISPAGLKGSGGGLVVGLLLTLYGGLGVAKAAQNALNRVWEVPKAKRPNFVGSTIRSIELLAVVGVGFLGTTLLSGLGAGGGTLGAGLRVVIFVGSLAVNVGLFLLAFKVLTAVTMPLRSHLPGAVMAGIAWQALQMVGGLYAARTKNGSAYGIFAVVIGLLSWLYLQAQVTLFAAELNTVLAHRLWPRSLVQPPLTEGDKRAYEEYANVERFRPEESVDVDFIDRPAANEKQRA